MKRALATTLCVLSLLFSFGCVLCAIAAMCVTSRLVDQSQVAAIETTLRTYADSLDSMRDNIDVTGSQIPVYALTLQKTSKLFQDAQKAADELEKLTALQASVPVLGEVQIFGGIEDIVQDLRGFLPQFANSLSAAEKSLSGYTPENHEKIIDAIDKTVLLLRLNADKLESQIENLRRCLYAFFGVCLLSAIAHGGLALAILLVNSASRGGAGEGDDDGDGGSGRRASAPRHAVESASKPPRVTFY